MEWKRELRRGLKRRPPLHGFVKTEPVARTREPIFLRGEASGRTVPWRRIAAHGGSISSASSRESERSATTSRSI